MLFVTDEARGDALQETPGYVAPPALATAGITPCMTPWEVGVVQW
jgi:hypothetical protein